MKLKSKRSFKIWRRPICSLWSKKSGSKVRKNIYSRIL